MTPRILLGSKAERAAVRALATGATRKAKRGAASNARLGASFEDEVEAACNVLGKVVRGHPETKVVQTRQGPKTIYTAKNGVDFVGVVCRFPVAAEAKRLPGATSLRGSKDDSTAAEAKWLAEFRGWGGRGGFLVHDPDRGTIYVVWAPMHLKHLALGGVVRLRETDGTPLVDGFTSTEAAVRFLAGMVP